MRITRIIALLTALFLAFSLAACNDNGKDSEKQNGGQEGSGENGNNGTENGEAGDGSEGGNNSENENTESTDVTVYVYSIITKSIHLSDCYHVNRINEDYKKEFIGDVNELLAKGDDYSLCRDCLDIKEETPGEDEENENKVSRAEATYLINASNGKFHVLDCHQTKGMKEENIQYTKLSIEELLELEYSPCGSCLEKWVTDKEDSQDE